MCNNLTCIEDWFALGCVQSFQPVSLLCGPFQPAHGLSRNRQHPGCQLNIELKPRFHHVRNLCPWGDDQKEFACLCATVCLLNMSGEFNQTSLQENIFGT